VKGYRVWVVPNALDTRPSLAGLSIGEYIWNPGINVARCVWSDQADSPTWAIHDSGDVPASSCMCGFWMLDTWEQATHKLHFPLGLYSALRLLGKSMAIGAVEGWGRTIVHSDGNRCEKARILGLVRLTFDAHLDLTPKLGLVYDVPVFESGLALQEFVNS
jgi:hypothetical protein